MQSEPLRFGDYRLENVYLRTSPEQRGDAAHFWVAAGALRDAAAAERRAQELVYLVRAAGGALAGMCTTWCAGACWRWRRRT